jgi:putative membrane protein
MNTLKVSPKWLALALSAATFLTVPAIAQNAPQPKLNDAQVASAAVTANQIDVNYGKIALKQSRNADIRKFAQTMVNDHTSIINQAAALAKKLGVTPEGNALTTQLLAGEKTTEKKLKSLKGKAFDKAYIDNEVAYHKAVIGAVTNVLIPQTKNEQLKDLLVKVSPLLEAHLKMAEKVQSAFK